MSLLKNKIVFISGASSGIGMACARAFAREGAKVILAARRRERIEKLAYYLLKIRFLFARLNKLDL